MPRQHFLFSLREADQVPGGNSPMGWLRYYKLNDENEEVFIPFSDEGRLAKPGDILWIMYEQQLLARVPILRVQDNAMNNDQVEVWYDARQLRYPRQSACALPRGPEYSTGILD